MNWLADARFVAFDFDGTLTDYVEADTHALEALRQQACPKVDSRGFLERAVEEIMAFHDRAKEGKSHPLEMDKERLEQTFSAFGIEYRPEHLAFYAAELIKATHPVCGAVELLAALQQRRIPLALLTNAYDGQLQRQRLKHCFPDQPFQAIVVAGESGMLKPDPRLFHILAETLGYPASAGIYIGDLPKYDAGGAKAAGMQAILVNSHPQQRLKALELGAEAVSTLSDLLS